LYFCGFGVCHCEFAYDLEAKFLKIYIHSIIFREEIEKQTDRHSATLAVPCHRQTGRQAGRQIDRRDQKREE